jgi:hypothetical protein
MHVTDSFSTVISLMAAAAPTELPTKILYDRKGAAFALSISVRALDYLIANKQIATRKLGKKIMIPHGELVRFSRADHHSLTRDPNEVAN